MSSYRKNSQKKVFTTRFSIADDLLSDIGRLSCFNSEKKVASSYQELASSLFALSEDATKTFPEPDYNSLAKTFVSHISTTVESVLKEVVDDDSVKEGFVLYKEQEGLFDVDFIAGKLKVFYLAKREVNEETVKISAKKIGDGIANFIAAVLVAKKDDSNIITVDEGEFKYRLSSSTREMNKELRAYNLVGKEMNLEEKIAFKFYLTRKRVREFFGVLNSRNLKQVAESLRPKLINHLKTICPDFPPFAQFLDLYKNLHKSHDSFVKFYNNVSEYVSTGKCSKADSENEKKQKDLRNEGVEPYFANFKINWIKKAEATDLVLPDSSYRFPPEVVDAAPAATSKPSNVKEDLGSDDTEDYEDYEDYEDAVNEKPVNQEINLNFSRCEEAQDFLNKFSRNGAGNPWVIGEYANSIVNRVEEEVGTPGKGVGKQKAEESANKMFDIVSQFGNEAQGGGYAKLLLSMMLLHVLSE